MSPDEVLEFLDGRSAELDEHAPTLAFDTNAIFGDTKKDDGVALIDLVNVANAARGARPEIGLVLSAVVLHEKIRQMAQRRGAAFDASLPLGFMQAKRLRVEAFDDAHALAVARRLADLYPRHGDWRAFKKRRCLQCLGLAEEASSRDGSECGATVDWLVVGHAEARGYLLVSNDTGPEFAGVRRRAPLATVKEAAERLVASRAAV